MDEIDNAKFCSFAEYEATRTKHPVNLWRTPAQMVFTKFANRRGITYSTYKVDYDNKKVVYSVPTDPKNDAKQDEKEFSFQLVAKFLFDWNDMKVDEMYAYAVVDSGTQLAEQLPPVKTVFTREEWDIACPHNAVRNHQATFDHAKDNQLERPRAANLADSFTLAKPIKSKDDYDYGVVD